MLEVKQMKEKGLIKEKLKIKRKEIPQEQNQNKTDLNETNSSYFIYQGIKHFRQNSINSVSSFEIKTNINEFLFESKCALEFEQKKYLLKLLGNKMIATTLLYRGTENGMYYSNFHTCCDNKGPTICLIQLLDGDCIGGVTSVSWSSECKREADSQAFLFNLTRERYFPSKTSGNNIYCHEKFGIAFNAGGFSELSLYSEPFDKEGHCRS